ncbi:UNKNOWN [Stylonychia lemnae]|uniref:Uncharacterized protein n=1 Tax=Stylonychia lemnae TaxID=5949 RepID=A0A077ZX18_STYLE|nr:UNKNOWN [Stylonychia lemnae]|eukprot:CDW74121.1 UNKNOWN [Stylonychia lemnae]
MFDFHKEDHFPIKTERRNQAKSSYDTNPNDDPTTLLRNKILFSQDSESIKSQLDDPYINFNSVSQDENAQKNEIQGTNYLQGLMKRYASPNKRFDNVQICSPIRLAQQQRQQSPNQSRTGIRPVNNNNSGQNKSVGRVNINGNSNHPPNQQVSFLKKFTKNNNAGSGTNNSMSKDQQQKKAPIANSKLQQMTETEKRLMKINNYDPALLNEEQKQIIESQKPVYKDISKAILSIRQKAGQMSTQQKIKRSKSRESQKTTAVETNINTDLSSLDPHQIDFYDNNKQNSCRDGMDIKDRRRQANMNMKMMQQTPVAQKTMQFLNMSEDQESQRYYSKHNLNKEKSTSSFISSNQEIGNISSKIQDISSRNQDGIQSDDLTMNSVRSYTSTNTNKTVAKISAENRFVSSHYSEMKLKRMEEEQKRMNNKTPSLQYNMNDDLVRIESSQSSIINDSCSSSQVQFKKRMNKVSSGAKLGDLIKSYGIEDEEQPAAKSSRVGSKRSPARQVIQKKISQRPQPIDKEQYEFFPIESRVLNTGRNKSNGKHALNSKNK